MSNSASILRRTVIVLLWLAAATISSAATIILTTDGNPINYHTYTYTDDNGVQHTANVGPYPVVLSGGSYGGGIPSNALCFDINIGVLFGTSYPGTTKPPDTIAEIQAAYLLDKLASLGGYSADVQTVAGPISMAIWQLMNPSSHNPAPFAQDPAAQSWVDQAVYAYSIGLWTAADAAAYVVWLPDPLGSTQRFGFLEGPPPPVVPEPASAIQLVAGLGLLLAIGKKRAARPR
jgi:hypothetical protein